MATRSRSTKVSRAFWLAIVCTNLFFVTRWAFSATTTGWQMVWFLLLGLWIRLTYKEIRRVQRGE